MQVNTARVAKKVYTAGGAPAYPHLKPLQELRRSVLACLLFEAEFYESGQKIADRIAALIPLCDANEVAALAIEARTEHNLRHVPLLIVREMARGPKEHRLLVADLLPKVIQRADELTEFLAIYWATDVSR